MSKQVAPPHKLWEVARLSTLELTDERTDELISWVSDVSGLSREEVRDWIRPEFCVSQSGEDRTYRLHLTRIYRNERGQMVVDHAAKTLQTEPLVFEITDFPAWLPAVSHEQGVS